MIRLLVLSALILVTNLLSGCSVLAQTPPDQAVRLAIAQTLTVEQQNITNALDLEPSKPSFKIEKIDIQSRQKITEPAFKPYPGEVYRVRGTFDAALKGAAKSLQVESAPFDIYLSSDPQDTEETETWYLLHPNRART